MITRMVLGLVVLALGGGCKEKSEPAPRPTAGRGSGSASAPVVVAGDGAVAAPIDAGKVLLPIDAANLPAVSAPDRAMVTRWFGQLNGTKPLVIKGVDVEPFRTKHVGQTIDAKTVIAYAAPPAEGKRTFVVILGESRLYMTFDAKDQLVGISY